MRLLYRWIANGLAFYLALYLVDSVLAPRFYIRSGWIAIVLAILLGGANSLVRPFPALRTKPGRALTAVLLTAIGNTIFIELLILFGAPLFASSPKPAVGPVSLTVTVAVAVSVEPSASVTVRVTV